MEYGSYPCKVAGDVMDARWHLINATLWYINNDYSCHQAQTVKVMTIKMFRSLWLDNIKHKKLFAGRAWKSI